MPEPSSSGGGSLSNQLMGIFRERSRQQQQLQMMAFGSALKVASDVTSTKLKGDEARKGLVKDFRTIYKKYPQGHPRAGEYVNPELATHVSEAGMEVTPSGYRFSPSSLTKLEQMKKGVGAFEQYKASASGVTPTTGPEKPGQKGKQGPVTTPVVNEQPQTVTPPNVGNRGPRATKGGFTQPAMFTKTGATTKAARPAAKKARTKNLGLGQTPNNPPMGGMNA